MPDGRVHDGVMTHVDLVPTILDLAGAEGLPGMEGRSYVRLLRGETDEHRDAVITNWPPAERVYGAGT